ncbi:MULTISPECIES: hypothetical protein [unclassified Mucilaginibacter]|uniref:hypothetical protein n=1 Tax=unclassified Mucilaginibacter TaxID=2617802 RepID=UPI00095CCE15|nr:MULTISPECIES: hypothetical protein [unclassified Mucilaginibacter]OJW18210.1 MAG: hypothetical protein BGO48_16755 [Mucilaginibacter sp. 44-25]PLW90460.1 MAG: hypothetical protein C0154_06330 [Mucilaginibacter sp.]HEK20636.1 hypothetical protein [Bacteroidota bacterium]
MAQQFEATLTGSDSTVDGWVTENGNGVYTFKSVDDSLELTIAKNEHGHWERVGGSEPYFSAWVEELAEQISINKTTI